MGSADTNTDTGDDWSDAGYITASQHRTGVYATLATEGPATPTNLSTQTGLDVTHVSRALSDLRERNIVELLVPEDQRKGRVYGLTEHGEQLQDHVQSLAENPLDVYPKDGGDS